MTYPLSEADTRSGSAQTSAATTSATVVAGAASVVYALPAGTGAGSYTIQAVYNGTTNFITSTDNTQSLAINPAATITAASTGMPSGLTPSSL